VAARLLAVVLAAVLVGAAGAATPVRVTLSAPTHTPKTTGKWSYSVHATKGGKPVAARITVQIVDPLGGVHAVDYGSSTKAIVNRPFTGTFRDYVIWSQSPPGIQLTFRVTVVAGGARKVVSYRVTPRA
jgi:hypothetical protein